MKIFLFLAIATLANVINVHTSTSQALTISSVTKKSYNGSDISCYGVKDAELTVHATGQGALLYSMNDGAYQTSAVFSNLGVGHYYFKAKDNKNNISNRVDIDVATNTIAVRITSLYNTGGQYGGSTSCFGSADGSFGISVDGGTGSILASKDDGATYQSSYYFDKLTVGTYQVKIKDANGCAATGTYTVKGPDPLNVTVKQLQFSCSSNNGSFAITPSGGAGSGYYYNIDNGPTTWSTSFSNLVGPDHSIKISDYRGCTSTVPVVLAKTNTAVASGNSATCTGSFTTFNINISSESNNTFSGIYKDNSGKTYPVNNLKPGNNTIITNTLSGNQTFSLVSVTSDAGCSAIASGTATVTTTDPGTWLGKDSDWFNGNNWSCGAIPNSTTNVTIPATKNNPVISSGTAAANNITLSNGAFLTVKDALQLAGTIIDKGNIDATTGTVELIGTSGQTISGSWFVRRTINNIKISNRNGLDLYTTTNDTLNITGILTFGVSNATFNTNNNLTLKSTVNGTATVADLTNNGAYKGNTITGNVTVERFINMGTANAGEHNKAWVMVSTPTEGQTIFQSWMENGDKHTFGYGTQITGNGKSFDAYSSAPALKYYNDANNSWTPITNSDLPVYNPLGYILFVRGDRSTSYPNVSNTTLRTTGTLLCGTSTPISVKAGKFQSIGNPYASAVDIRKISSTNINADIIVWDPTLTTGNGYGVGAYQVLYKDGNNYRNLLTSSAYGPAGTISNNIESGVAFFVQSFKADGQVYFTENSKAPGLGKGIAMREEGAEDNSIHISTSLNVVNADSTYFVTDGSMEQFSKDYSNEIDGMDTRKLSNTSENLSIRRLGRDLTIERRNFLSSADTIFYNLTGVTGRKYRFIFNANGLTTMGVTGFIEDTYTDTKTPLNADGDTQLDFNVTSVAASKAANRFRVVFKEMQTMPVTFTSIKANAAKTTISVNWKVENQSNLKEYVVERSADGKNFSQVATLPATKTNAFEYNWLDQQPQTGVNFYRVKSVDLNGKKAFTSIVKGQISGISTSINVYPNPAVNANLNIQLNNEPAGIYYVRLVNQLGQVMVSEKINHTAGSNVEKIEWNKETARGIYDLQISMPDGGMKVFKIAY